MAALVPQSRITVKPVFLISNLHGPPRQRSRDIFMTVLSRVRTRYLELLGHLDTFEIAIEAPLDVSVEWSSSVELDFTNNCVKVAIKSLLRQENYDQHTCPFIYACIMAGLESLSLNGRGTTFNGKVNTGGGIALLPEGSLVDPNRCQAQMEHELGHTFGLLHPRADHAAFSDRIMSQHRNPNSPGLLSFEDYIILAHASRVFPRFGESREDLRAHPCDNLAIQPPFFIGE